MTPKTPLPIFTVHIWNNIGLLMTKIMWKTIIITIFITWFDEFIKRFNLISQNKVDREHSFVNRQRFQFSCSTKDYGPTMEIIWAQMNKFLLSPRQSFSIQFLFNPFFIQCVWFLFLFNTIHSCSISSDDVRSFVTDILNGQSNCVSTKR